MTREDTADRFVVAGEPLELVDVAPDIGVRPVADDSFPEAHIAVHRPTGAAAWGATRDDAIEQVEQDADHVRSPDRTGAIVETPGVLGGKPRVAGSRIGVLHVVNRFEETDSLLETAAGFTGSLTIEEARKALDWADSHPDELTRLRADRANAIERIRSAWDPIERSGKHDIETYRRPGTKTFAVFSSEEEGP